MSKKKHRKGESKGKPKFKGGDKKLKTGLYHLIRKLFQNHPDATLNYKDVCSLLHVKDSETRKVIVTVLIDLANEGTLRQNGFQAYQLNNNLDVLEGELQLTQRGSGFVIISKNEKDIFIPPHHIGQAIDGDIVKVAITKDGGERREGRIVDIVSRERTQFVGTIQVKDQQGFLLPEDHYS
jgi:exoribonuclease R